VPGSVLARGSMRWPFSQGNERDKEAVVTCVLIGAGGGHSCRSPRTTMKKSSP